MKLWRWSCEDEGKWKERCFHVHCLSKTSQLISEIELITHWCAFHPSSFGELCFLLVFPNELFSPTVSSIDFFVLFMLRCFDKFYGGLASHWEVLSRTRRFPYKYFHHHKALPVKYRCHGKRTNPYTRRGENLDVSERNDKKNWRI